MATLTTKFSLRDQVYRISSDVEVIRLPCTDCRGTGRVTAQLANNRTEQVRCPRHTGGTGMATIKLGSWPVWRANDNPLVIGQIQLRIYDRSGVDNGESADNRNPASVEKMHENDEEGYMCWSTGVGSGMVHYAEDLFASLEEAEAEAKERTERARAGEDPSGRPDRWAKWWPSTEQVRVAAGFLDHRDIYEHDAAHVALAEAIIEVGAKRDKR